LNWNYTGSVDPHESSRPVGECGNPHPVCIINSRGCGFIVPKYAALHMRTHQWTSHVATTCFTFQTVIRFSRALVNVMGECFASEIVQ